MHEYFLLRWKEACELLKDEKVFNWLDRVDALGTKFAEGRIVKSGFFSESAKVASKIYDWREICILNDVSRVRNVRKIFL